MTSRVGPLSLAIMLAIGLLTACGSGERKEIQVQATDDSCQVSPSEAASGSLLTFTVTNAGTQPTEFSLRDPEGNDVLRSGEITPDTSRDLEDIQINKAGEFTAVCKPGGQDPGIRSGFTLTE